MQAMTSANRPDLLRELVDTARKVFGFYTRSADCLITYPWAADLLERLPQRSRVLEVGAGVSPLPLFLAHRGLIVDCVDNSPIVRTLPVTDDWDEWGFFDYGQLHDNLTAFHCPITRFKSLSSTYDAIYSIGSFVTMTADVRNEAFRLCRCWLRSEGLFIITLAIVPGTDQIWNLSRGIQVESPDRHGRIEAVLHQIRTVGFRIDREYITRSIPGARADVLFVECRPQSPARECTLR